MTFEIRCILCAAALLGALGVALGAFGAHFLKEKLSEQMLAVYEVGVRYQMYHIFALFVTAWALSNFPHTAFQVASWTFLIGITLFSGSLYILALTAVKAWGMVTPIGGLFLIIGWLSLFWGFLNGR